MQTHGKGPSERVKHAAAIFNQYFVVHGGRNDKLYCETLKTVALNDLHLMDMTTNTWTTVAIFCDEVPVSRWGHSLVASQHKLLLFGGMNLH